MMAVPVRSEADIVAERPKLLFEGLFHYTITPNRTYDVAPDGRFLMVAEPEKQYAARQLIVVTNWSTQARDTTRAQALANSSVEASRRMAITCQPSAHSLCSAAPIRRHPSGLLRPRLATNLGPRAHLQIGRAYAMQGDTAKAKPAYQDFLRLWKDADPDIPILIREKRNTRSCNNL